MNLNQTKIKETHDALLKTINEIAKRFEPAICFQNFDQASTEENIVKFALNYFHVYKKIDIRGITKFKDLIEFLTSNPINKLKSKMGIDATSNNELSDIQYIQEPKFNILVFNFKTAELRKSSAISFYSNFLNSYFLKKSKQELYNRCRILLKKTNDETSEQDNLLRKWTTYVDLCDIINYTKTGITTFFIDEKIIDEKFLSRCPINEKLPDVIYYQLQFIFNYLDSKVPTFPLIESLFIALNKVQKIDIKGKDFIKVITQSIRVKNISFILQKKKYEKVIQNDSLNENNSKISEETEYSNDDHFSKTFVDRLKSTMQDQINKYKVNHKKMIFKDFKDFWNCSDTDFEFGNDIFFDNVDGNKINEDNWKNGFDCFSNGRGSEATQNEDFKYKDFKYPQTDPSGKGTLYKIFYYNETDSKWQVSDDYINFFKSSKIHIKNSKTPLIYFSNSKEEKLENLVSKLINTSYPDINNINDNQIYVYAFCDKSLQSIAGDMSDSEEEKRKPILLILHVPEEKKKLSNIKTIVYQISTFLSFICDIEIVVLNKDHYVDQINRIIDVENIKRSYTNESKDTSSNKAYIEEFEYFEDDLDDDFEPGSGKPNLLNEKINNIETSVLSELSEKVFKKCHKLLFILDDENFEYNYDFEIRKSHNSLIISIGNKIHDNCNNLIPDFTVINLNNTKTYKGFLDTFINLARSIETESGEVIANFECILSKPNLEKLLPTSSVYFRLKSQKDYEDKLKEISQTRFQMLKFDKLYKSQNLFNPQTKNEDEDESDYDQNNDLRHLSGYSILLDLQKELYSICPPMDSDFCHACNEVIKKIESDVVTKECNIKKELRASDFDIKAKLIKTINKRPYWTDKAKFDLILSYDQHLRNEYFEMIFNFYPPREAASIYQSDQNLKDLNSLIEKGKEELDAEFKRKEEEIAQMKKTKGQELKDKIKKGTDYHIREIENENEFKLTVEVGKNIDDYIDPDF